MLHRLDCSKKLPSIHKVSNLPIYPKPSPHSQAYHSSVTDYICISTTHHINDRKKKKTCEFTIRIFWSFCCFLFYRMNFILLNSFLDFCNWCLTISRATSFSLSWPAFHRYFCAFWSVPFSFLSFWELSVNLSSPHFWTFRWGSVPFWLGCLLCCSVHIRFLCLYSCLYTAFFLNFGFLFFLLFLLLYVKKIYIFTTANY